MDTYLSYFYKNEKWFLAARFTFSWIVVGLLAFSFEWIVTRIYHVNFSSQVFFLLYVLPPIFVGFPMMMIELTHLEKHLKKLRFGYYFAVKTSIYLASIIFVYFAIWYFVLEKSAYSRLFSGQFFILKHLFVWGIGTALIFFFKNMSDHIDRKNLWRWLIGKYFKPIEERRIFLFMDLNHSTMIAESLGHIRYFEFINDFYGLSARTIEKLKGEIYQYVGDEVVISWNTQNGISHNNALNLIFEIEKIIEINSNYFLTKYGIIPQFKGSLHFGEVTRGEIGVLKKEFVFAGDVLNTASRMHKVCKEYEVSLVVSDALIKMFDLQKGFIAHPLGDMKLKGKKNKTVLYGVKKEGARA